MKGKAKAMANGQRGSMRQAMPTWAAIVDALRADLGREAVDKALAEGIRKGRTYMAELGPDGALHELGGLPDGRRAREVAARLVIERGVR